MLIYSCLIVFKINFMFMFCLYREIIKVLYHRVMLSSNKTVVAFNSVWTCLVLMIHCLLLHPLLHTT